MNDDTDAPPSVDEFVDYCQIQAGLLSGRVETIATEATDLLDEIDEDVATLRARLEERGGDVAGTATPSSAGGPGDVDVDALEELQDDLEHKQRLAEAKGARMQAFQELAAAYTELAEEVGSADDAAAALEEIVRFEVDNDAPAYFDDRRTLCEAAAEQANAVENDTEQ
ncbi:hypothetical protein EA462_14745 [Natrarchaeobius halalkaliphilus]|uniref:Uncharacterized protein n=1 Tax=Natrarchaeobius halalkaliphilus TaxID=1679091 RepID=A0A3N6LMY2_9EURY|nr:hypothetical protein [Natrarchaeobius halalkaliphilus]RQG86915.1 hypothetical protein EA462_14745 [Natrarchaeobius halalkaliphilus]